MHLRLNALALVLAVAIPALAEDPIYTSAITGSAHPIITPAPKGPRPAVQVAGPLTISVTNSFGRRVLRFPPNPHSSSQYNG